MMNDNCAVHNIKQ